MARLLFVNKLKNINLFFENCRKFIPKKRIILANSEEISNYLASCILIERKVLGVIRVSSSREVSKIVKLANLYSISLYPTSTGKNWGYGSANPFKNNCLILDLSLMNTISNYDDTLGYVTIEPGVTQQDLYEFLKNTSFKMDPTGSAPSTSVLANSIERGFGIGFLNNHFENISNLSVVLANGEIIKTGFGHYGDSKNKDVYKYGIGPHLDGLFSQSNMGIVTSATLYLAPKFEQTNLVVAQFDSHDLFEDVLDLLQKLRMHEVIRSPINVFYRKRLLSVKQRFPFERTSLSYLSEELAKELGREHSVTQWSISTSLFGTKEQVKASFKEIKKQFKLLGIKVHSFSEQDIEKFSNASFFTKFFVKKSMKLDLDQLSLVLKRGIDIFLGVPSNVSMRSPYWRSKTLYHEDNPNPAIDNCGLYWISPVIPLKGEFAKKAFSIGEDVCRKYGFDFAPTYTLGGPRFIDNTIPLMYNKDDKEETQRAYLCYRQLIQEFKQAGFMIYRSGITAMDLVIDKKDPFWKFTKTIKKAIDKKSIIAPGKYG